MLPNPAHSTIWKSTTGGISDHSSSNRRDNRYCILVVVLSEVHLPSTIPVRIASECLRTRVFFLLYFINMFSIVSVNFSLLVYIKLCVVFMCVPMCTIDATGTNTY